MRVLKSSLDYTDSKNDYTPACRQAGIPKNDYTDFV
jgi:hypothetical protein